MKTFELENEEGLRLRGLEFGATLTSLSLPVAGVRREVLLGCADEAYATQQVWLGAVAGRFANRIGGAELVRGDERWSLDANQAPHCLHGGRAGFHRQPWQIKEREADRGRRVRAGPEVDHQILLLQPILQGHPKVAGEALISRP